MSNPDDYDDDPYLRGSGKDSFEGPLIFAVIWLLLFAGIIYASLKQQEFNQTTTRAQHKPS